MGNIKNIFKVLVAVMVFSNFSWCLCAVEKPEEALMVRLSKIEVKEGFLEEYKAFLEDEIKASMKLERGVLTLYAVSDKSAPNKFTILEIYANEAAYKEHIKSPHFQKYKRGTLEMVKSLELVDVIPLIPNLKIK